MNFYLHQYAIDRRIITKPIFAESPHEGLKSITLSKGEIIAYSGMSYFSCIPNICWWSISMRAAYPDREHRLVDFGS